MNDESDLKDPVLPLGRAIVGSAGQTGTWRTSKPTFVEENCTKCYQCWVSCPEGTIRVEARDEYPEIEKPSPIPLFIRKFPVVIIIPGSQFYQP